MKPMSLAELSKPRLQVQVSLSKRLIARALWDYAEDAHVQRALDLTEDEGHHPGEADHASLQPRREGRCGADGQGLAC